MDIRPLGFAAWIAAVAAVAACGPRSEDRLATDSDSVAARTAAAGQDPRATAAATEPDTRRIGAAPAPAAPASDAQITAEVRAAIAAAQDLRGARIDVDTQGGVVTLSGSVPTAAIKARASELAKGTRAVRSVNDQLTMATG